MQKPRFHIESECPGTLARAGRLDTCHGSVATPVFMPVGTQATVKSQTADLLRESGSKFLLANTYHLMLRPGTDVFKHIGGIHRFMSWDGPVLTDSGGFQIFSLPHSRTMEEAGATFQSYVDGRTHLLSPERSIEVQKAIGSDIMMVLDQCVPSTVEHPQARAAMELTHRWAVRSLAARQDSPQGLFGIVQGACFEDLRKESAAFLTQLPFDGFAIGGLAVGETKTQRDDYTALTASLLPKERPRYLMGVGTPLDILEAVHRGVDMFDCILPSQLAQRGGVYTAQGRLQMRRGIYRLDDSALDPDCDCPTCHTYSRAYLHHLTKVGEHLGWTLLTRHNLFFYHSLMRKMRRAIIEGTFSAFYLHHKEALARTDNPVGLPPRSRDKNKRPMVLGDYRVHIAEAGFWSIQQRSSNEIMHSVSPPMEEAARLYTDQSRLAARLREPGPPLVVWDVGLGAATNAMAALRCKQGADTGRSLLMVSFENDLDPLRLALRHPDRFPHLQHGAPHALLADGTWNSACGDIQWRLEQGDFEALLCLAPVPDIIFYDPFSSKTNPRLWTHALFGRVFDHCRGHDTELFTYSASTAVRAALLAAGFYVAKGVGTGPKSETTIALAKAPGPTSERALLETAWIDRWGRSDAKYPLDLAEASRAEFESLIVRHPQFA